ncbi:plasmid mobilization protein [Sphingobacterium sp. SGL-16]|uniref:plasmid mobilization protein n=1 Tax=Sphingobacterium sp. SGL-16 TaxID=2710883 RepID=UPI0013EC110E|nr:plasmid mobilization relaxosome protein MobC [Sphingobacterium sp. SGL-16]NGM74797.1 MobC family plasmid mobilization relaxosome protein [Sphingobacterium sp. SGL-16]
MNKKDNPRLKNIVIRVNDKEHKEIESKAGKLGLTISEYGRQLMLKGAVLSAEKKDSIQAGTGIDRRTIIGLANNLNQLTRLANQRKELPQIESLLKDIEKIIKEWS